MSFLQEDPNKIAEINGHDVFRQELGRRITRNEALYQAQTQGKPLNSYQKDQVAQMSWEEMIFEYAYRAEFERLGIEVTAGEDCLNCEEVEMVQGANPHPSIKEIPIFKNEDGEFDRSKVKEFIKQLYDPKNANNQQLAQQKAYWENNIIDLKKRLLTEKYTCLLYTSPSPRDKRQSRMPSSA